MTGSRTLVAHLVAAARSAPSPAAVDLLIREALEMCADWMRAEHALVLHRDGDGFRVPQALPPSMEGMTVAPHGLATLRRVVREGGLAAIPPGELMARLAANRRLHGLAAALESASGPVGLLFLARTAPWPRSDRRQVAVVARLLGTAQSFAGQTAVLERLRGQVLMWGETGLETGIRPLADIERDAIVRTLQATAGRIYGADGAARLLGLHPNTLRSRMQKHGLGGARDHRQGG